MRAHGNIRVKFLLDLLINSLVSLCANSGFIKMEKIDYTKYKLKTREEILDILGGKEKIFVLSCTKCFNELKTDVEPEPSELSGILSNAGKVITGMLPLEFLCNEHLTDKALASVKAEIDKADAIAVISCGVGIQTIAGLLKKSVLGVTDSGFQGGYHGIALFEEKCGACGTCYLTVTGGICPVVDCSKGLLNGPCGGTKNGKCEVSKDRDCGWEKIYKRLNEQKRTALFINEKTAIRDYKINGQEFIETYSKNIIEKRNEGFYGGIYPDERKELTEKMPIELLPAPDVVIIPMQQHAGACAEPVVKKGERVKKGQIIGKANGFVSANVHASVSGEVLDVCPKKHPLLPFDVLSVVIKNDHKNILHESIRAKENATSLPKADLLKIIEDAGIVGMGGAQFPTHVKLKSSKPIDTILINGCECEPLLNADNRLMIEKPAEIIKGLTLIMSAAGVSKGIVAIENNKPEAIEAMKKAAEGNTSIEVVSVKTKYPEGAERMLIKRVLNREVPAGGLPLDVGVIVNNTATAYAVYDAVYNGMPLISRIVTVAGENTKKMGNFIVAIGTTIADIVKYCGIKISDDCELKMGGAIMGFVQNNFEAPVIKGTNGISVVKKQDDLNAEPCIKCGRCVNVCPMDLKPHKLVFYAQAENWDGVKKEGVMNCIECGCCENICSSKSHMIEIFRKSKKVLREKK